MRILIAGDLVPTESNKQLFENGNIEELLGESLKDVWESSTLRIFNLEAPVTDVGTPIKKSGPNLRIPESCIKGIERLKPSLITVANNHIMDYGEAGWRRTKELLNKSHIKYIGAGDTVEDAAKSWIIHCKGRKIGFYACAEHEFSVATEKKAGANGFDVLLSLQEIKELHKEADFVVVLYHGGKEHYPYPTPNQRKVCRSIVEMGADLVVCQHSHCVGCMENYKNAAIIYGQGNFIFDYSREKCWQTGIIVDLDLSDHIELNYIPIYKRDAVVRKAEGRLKKEILDEFSQRNMQINSVDEVNRLYREYSKKVGLDYLYHYAGWNRVMRGIDKKIFKGALINKYYSDKKRISLLGLLQCETHKEIMECYLKNII